MEIKIAPSILASDFANLQSEAEKMRAAGADWLHVDVMDGHFVPNLSLGLPVLQSLRKVTDLTLDVHLMITDPLAYAERFLDCGADLLVFHLESDSNPASVVRTVREKGGRCGIALRPGTPAEAVSPYLPDLDLVLVMTVEPGFGGQSFLSGMLPKLAAVRAELTRRGLSAHLQVDGGIDLDTAPQAVAAGADVLVAGNMLFTAPDYGAAVAGLRAAAMGALRARGVVQPK